MFFKRFTGNTSLLFFVSGLFFLILTCVLVFGVPFVIAFLEVFFNKKQTSDFIISGTAIGAMIFIFISIFCFLVSLIIFIINKFRHNLEQVSNTQVQNPISSLDKDKSAFVQHVQRLPKKTSYKFKITAREDLQNAIDRTWKNYFSILGMVKYIEGNLTPNETVLYVTKAKISTGHMSGRKMIVYDFNQNISGVLIITSQLVWHFSKRDSDLTAEIMSLDDVSLEIIRSFLSSFIHLQSIAGISGMDISGLNNKELHVVANIIQYSANKQQQFLEEKIRKKRKN